MQQKKRRSFYLKMESKQNAYIKSMIRDLPIFLIIFKMGKLIWIPKQKICITVRLPNAPLVNGSERRHVFEMLTTSKISDLKKEIFDLLGIPQSEQILITPFKTVDSNRIFFYERFSSFQFFLFIKHYDWFIIFMILYLLFILKLISLLIYTILIFTKIQQI